MRKLLITIMTLLALPAAAQQFKTTFTAGVDCVSHIPVYEQGKTFYVNPYAGGQSSDLVVLQEGKDSYRIWDNSAKVWVTEPLVDCKIVFFINPDLLFVGKNNDRCGLFNVADLDKLSAEDRYLLYSDWTFKLNDRKEIEYLLLALGEKWGLMGPDGTFLVPTRYPSAKEAWQALPLRHAAEKPMDMKDMDFIISELRRLQEERILTFAQLHLDWSWYDSVTGSYFYTLEELPWAGPYCLFSGNFDYQPEVLEEGAREVIWDVALGVKNGVLSFIPDPVSFNGKLFPLMQSTLAYTRYEPFPVEKPEGAKFIGKLGVVGNHEGILLNPDGSYQIGYFIGFIFDNALSVSSFECCPGDWKYKDYLFNYTIAAHNKGEDPTTTDVLEAFRKDICNSRVDYWFYPERYDAKAKKLVLLLNPDIEIHVPATKDYADKFMKEYNKYDLGDYQYIDFDRLVRDDGEIYIEYLYIKNPAGTRLYYYGE